MIRRGQAAPYRIWVLCIGVALASEIGPGFSPDIAGQKNEGLLAPGCSPIPALLHRSTKRCPWSPYRNRRRTRRPAHAAGPVDPLAGVTLLIPNGLSEEAAAKGVRLTPKALKRIRIAMAKENVSPEQGGMRLGIQGGGCSGRSYNIRFDTKPRER